MKRLQLGVIISLLALTAMVGPRGSIVSAQPAFKIAWTIPELGQKVDPVDEQALQQYLVRVQMTYSDASRRGEVAPVVSLKCQNPESGEESQTRLNAVSDNNSDNSWALKFNLDNLWLNMPYPIDPGAVESKPMAIISQRTGTPPFSMAPAQLRQEFAQTAEYMLTTARHHYGMPFGDGQLNCFFVSVDNASAQTAVESPVLHVQFGRGLPDGVFPRDMSRPDMTGWHTWVIGSNFDAKLAALPAADSPEMRRELDLLLSLQAQRTPQQIALIRHWDNGSAVGPWMEITLDSIIRHNLNPVRSSRALALVSVAMYDATVAGSRAAQTFKRSAPCSVEIRLKPIGGECSSVAYPSEHAAVAGAASSMLAFLFPDQSKQFETQAQEAVYTRLWAGTDYPSGVEAGLTLGRLVGKAVVERAKADGSDAAWDGVIPANSGWIPTPPDFQPKPTEPLAGTWKPWNLVKGSQFRPGPPPLPGSAEFETEMREVYNIGSPLNLDRQQIASYWEDKKGSYTPPGHWNVIALKLIRTYGLSTAQSALVFAAMNTAEADAFIAAWDTKYTYWSIRPVSAIQKMIDPKWEPYIYTPPFPSYVSGHSTVSGAASTVLKYFFFDQSAQLEAWSQQAAISRLYGGIHFKSDNEVGLALGQKVGGEAVAKIKGIQWARN